MIKHVIVAHEWMLVPRVPWKINTFQRGDPGFSMPPNTIQAINKLAKRQNVILICKSILGISKVWC